MRPSRDPCLTVCICLGAAVALLSGCGPDTPANPPCPSHTTALHTRADGIFWGDRAQPLRGCPEPTPSTSEATLEATYADGRTERLEIVHARVIVVPEKRGASALSKHTHLILSGSNPAGDHVNARVFHIKPSFARMIPRVGPTRRVELSAIASTGGINDVALDLELEAELEPGDPELPASVRFTGPIALECYVFAPPSMAEPGALSRDHEIATPFCQQALLRMSVDLVRVLVE